MRMWLYQLNQTTWPPELFRRDIWEGQLWHFRCGEIRRANGASRQETPKLGDIVVFFYFKKPGRDPGEPGIYGWGVIDRIEKNDGDHAGHDHEDRLYFIPSTPTNHLKMDPWWDEKGGEVQQIIDAIRRDMPQATLFDSASANGEVVQRIRKGIKRWLRQ